MRSIKKQYQNPPFQKCLYDSLIHHVTLKCKRKLINYILFCLLNILYRLKIDKNSAIGFIILLAEFRCHSKSKEVERYIIKKQSN